MSLDPLTAIFDLGTKLVDKLIPDPQKKAEAQLELVKLQQNGDLAKLAAETDIIKGQLAINAEEAKSTNWFVAGARPCVMWICAFALAYVSILEPFARFVAQVYFGYNGAFPVIDTSITMQILFGVLGLGGYRTYEKVKGVSRN